MKVKIGKIDFANLYPIYHFLEKSETLGACRFIKGVPSKINALLRENSLDIAPSSSIEYLRNRAAYDLIEGHSVSSGGSIKSILLFSKVRIEDLGNKTILSSVQSETGAALLKIIITKFYGLNARFQISSLPLREGLKDHSAFFLIGDDALREGCKINNLLEVHGSGEGEFYVYDLGEIWQQHTDLPFVFALWITGKGKVEKSKIDAFRQELDQARDKALLNFENLAVTSFYSKIFSADLLLSYWKSINYTLSDLEFKGLMLFEHYLRELGLIDTMNS